MDSLVVVKKNEPFTDSLKIAEGTGNQHKSVSALIRKHQKRFERWGKVYFSYFKSPNSGRGRPTKVYELNEQQATFLITLLDNTEIVADFKSELVDQFCNMKNLLREKQTTIWMESRKVGILARKAETNIIQQLCEYAKSQGSAHSEKLYVVYSRLADKIAGIEPKKRDFATVKQLNRLEEIENMIWHVIKLGMEKGEHYKQIYKDCKERLEMYLSITFQGRYLT